MRYALVLFLTLVAVTEAMACSVPVFGYALRRWPADMHVLSVPTQEVAERLAAQIKGRTANVEITVDAALPATAARIQFPHAGSPSEAQWCEVPHATLNLRELIASPIRSRIIADLTNGESAVWLVVKSGSAAADAAAVSMLSKRLDVLKTLIEVPEQDTSDSVTDRTLAVPAAPLRIGFTIIALEADNRAEEWLRRQIAWMPQSATAGPAIIPIFGQGRALDVLKDKQISDEMIDNVTTFLTGRCSCQIKEQNPGYDLLIEGDWFEMMETAAQRHAQSATKAASATSAARPATDPHAGHGH